MDIEHDGTTYLQVSFLTRTGSGLDTNSQEPMHKRYTNNFFSVACLYGRSLGPGVKSDVLHHVGLGMKLYGAGGFSNAVMVSESGVAKLPRISPDNDEFSEPDFYRDLITELRISLHPPIRCHENVITLENIQWTAGPTSIGGKIDFMWPVLEFETAGGTLLQLLRKRPTLPFTNKINLCLDLAKALDCLHECGIIHSDVKSENVFIFPHPQRRYIAKIADFGCSTILEDPGACAKLSGFTKLWCVPEWDSELTYQGLCRTDIYSFGLVLWQVITDGKTPFEWFSWVDSAPLSYDDISALKNDHCMLPLALEEVRGLQLADCERVICEEVFTGTLGYNELRADFLVPLMENSWISETWGQRDLGMTTVGRTHFLEPIPDMDITRLFHDLTLDHRVPMQILDSIKIVVSSAAEDNDEPTVASASYQVFLCYYHGYGTDRDLKAAMSALLQAATYGNCEAQGLVAQFHEAHSAEIPSDAAICDWLETEVLSRCAGAARSLASLNIVRHNQAISKLNSTVETEMGVFSFSLCGIESIITGYTPEKATLIEEIEGSLRFQTGLSLIHIAAASGNASVVRSLLDHGLSDSYSVTSSGERPLYLECQGGHHEVALMLLSQQQMRNRTPNATDEKETFHNCLKWLPSFSRSSIMEIATHLIHSGASINGCPEDGFDTPLLRCVIHNNIEAAKVLLGFGAKGTALVMGIAASLRCSEILYLLLYDVADKGGRLGQTELGKLIYTATVSDTFSSIKLHGFQHSCAVISTFETLEFFINLWYPGLDQEIEQEKCSAVRRATFERRFDILQLVLDPFFKTCIRSFLKEGNSTLLYPLCLGDTAMFSLFIDNGAAKYGRYHTSPFGTRFNSLDQVFVKAIRSANPFFIQRLLEQGLWLSEDRLYEAIGGPADFDTGAHFCPFQLAVLEGCYDTATFLAKGTMQIETSRNPWNVFLGVVIGLTESHGLTKLDYLLNLKDGPPPLPDIHGGTILHLLALYWSVEPESRRGSLRRYWAKLMSRFQDLIDQPMNDGQTPLDLAIARHNVLMVEALIDADVSLNTLNHQGLTALDKLLNGRVIQVMRANPAGPPPTASELAINKELGSCKLPFSGVDIAKTDGPMSITGINGFTRNYQGDSYDKRLNTIYTMIRKAGGVSSVFPEPFVSTENLDNWTSIWVRMNQPGGTKLDAEGETREIVNRMTEVYGHLWRLPSGDGQDSYVVIS